MNDPTYKAEPSYDPIDALKLVPLFYTVRWTPAKKAEWLRITGSAEATTKVLCDHVRSAIEVHQKRPFQDHKETALHIVRGAREILTVRMSEEVAEIVQDRITEELQDAFDLGCKAAGGTIMANPPDGLVALALDRGEIDALMWLIKRFDDAAKIGDSYPRRQEAAIARVREKLEFHATREKP